MAQSCPQIKIMLQAGSSAYHRLQTVATLKQMNVIYVVRIANYIELYPSLELINCLCRSIFDFHDTEHKFPCFYVNTEKYAIAV